MEGSVGTSILLSGLDFMEHRKVYEPGVLRFVQLQRGTESPISGITLACGAVGRSLCLFSAPQALRL